MPPARGEAAREAFAGDGDVNDLRRGTGTWRTIASRLDDTLPASNVIIGMRSDRRARARSIRRTARRSDDRRRSEAHSICPIG
jgi:hypothetical protein